MTVCINCIGIVHSDSSTICAYLPIMQVVLVHGTTVTAECSMKLQRKWSVAVIISLTLYLTHFGNGLFLHAILTVHSLYIATFLLPGCSSFLLPCKYSACLTCSSNSFPLLIGRTSTLTHQQCLLQLVLPLKDCLTLALYSPSLASSLLSSPILERSEWYYVARAYVCN